MVARASKGQMTVQEAGRKGGQRTASTHGRDFYSEIGHKGGQKGGPKVRRLIEEGKRAQRR
ncbi:MAG: KGG domain-containing protein [bacterium]|nr:KGG domain-containing protein [bacterium]